MLRALCTTVFVALAGAGADASDISADEEVIFFSTVGHLDPARGVWVLPIHGWIFEPERDDVLRQRTLETLRRALDLPRDAERTQRFLHRARTFLVDNERGQRIRIRLGDRDHAAGTSRPDGHFEATMTLPQNDAERLLGAQKSKDWLTFTAVTRAGDSRRFEGNVLLLGDTGLSVISDIDDTIKVSEVADKRALLANTFLHEYRAVPGMADRYRRWAADGAAFHYVSDSPWQLYQPLTAFLREAGFPAGTMHLKLFRWKDSSFFDLFTEPRQRKLRVIEPLLRSFPGRKFILVGDTGEQDPEIFGELARKHPHIEHVYMRDTTKEAADGERLKRAFADVPAKRWELLR
jgi:phosphatidate phosphatase APP1